MSDYLWDKTGEPDAETERLENLLGQLRFQPTPFDLPAEIPAREPRPAPLPRSVFTWPRLALAASLTLAMLAGAWLMLRQQSGATNGPAEMAKQNAQMNAGGKQVSPAAPKADGGATETKANDEGKGDETPAVAPTQGDETQREEHTAVRRRPRLPDLANNRPRRLPHAAAPHSSRGESAKRRDNLTPPPPEPAQREEMARAEREAAEKVLYALRITSEKLNYARQQVQDTSRGEDNR
ncbi:MAG TPA: hypothetical protein VK421_07635 [Pyrinomonadaceae bacterium]|nr:hypothetical protein [Pyrinomonadaceae bacterium]